ncbi:MAG: GNAT family N-acetyltransferase [Devosia sp.]
MILGLSDGFQIRQASEADRPALSSICLQTGAAGEDATAREDDGTLLGLIFAVPYQVFEPELAFVLEGPGGVCGYVLGALDTKSFNARLAADWYPQLQQRITAPPVDRALWSGSDWARHHIHHPTIEMPRALAPYPSHGHIDLLPDARGRGFGRELMGTLERKLAQLGSPGMHLGVAPSNERAREFYRRIGFEEMQAPDLPEQTVYMVKRLGGSSARP